MRKILVIGAGRSTYSLIKYLLDNAESENWKVKVGDISIELAQQKVVESSFGSAIRFNVTDELQCESPLLTIHADKRASRQCAITSTIR